MASQRPGKGQIDPALAWSADGVEKPDSYVDLYTPGSLHDLRFRFMRRLVVGARRWRAYADQKLRRIGQSQARWESLLCVSLHGSMSQSELARLVSIEDPTAARMLASLEQDGHVDRVTGTGDRRRRIVRVTPEGEKVLAAMQLVIDLLRDSVLQDLEPAELEAGLRILNKMLARLEQV